MVLEKASVFSWEWVSFVPLVHQTSFFFYNFSAVVVNYYVKVKISESWFFKGAEGNSKETGVVIFYNEDVIEDLVGVKSRDVGFNISSEAQVKVVFW